MKNEKSKKILLILNLPPPFGGGEIRSKYLFDHIRNNENFKIIATSRIKSNKSNHGKFTVSNFFFGIILFFKTLYYIIYYKPSKLYLGIPKEFYPFIKISLLISIAWLFKIRIYGELAGESFLFLKKDNYQKKIGLFFLRKIFDLRVLGQSVKLQLAKYNITKLTVIDNGIYVPDNNGISRDLIFSETLNILFVGALNYSKGIKNLFEAINILKNEEIKIHLHLMGEWSNEIQKNEIFNYITSNNLSEFITFYGLVKSKMKWEIYQKCQILAHPTYWDGQPLVILEAMGCGLVVISTKVGAIPDTMKNNFNGIILTENTPSELSKTIKYFYTDRPKILELSKNNIRTFRERFTLEAYLLKMTNWLES